MVSILRFRDSEIPRSEIPRSGRSWNPGTHPCKGCVLRFREDAPNILESGNFGPPIPRKIGVTRSREGCDSLLEIGVRYSEMLRQCCYISEYRTPPATQVDVSHAGAGLCHTHTHTHPTDRRNMRLVGPPRAVLSHVLKPGRGGALVGPPPTRVGPLRAALPHARVLGRGAGPTASSRRRRPRASPGCLGYVWGAGASGGRSQQRDRGPVGQDLARTWASGPQAPTDAAEPAFNVAGGNGARPNVGCAWGGSSL